MAEPGGLALGVAPRIALASLRRCGQFELAPEVPDQPGHAMRLHSRQRRVETAAGERTHLDERAGGEHGVEAGIDAAAALTEVERAGRLQIVVGGTGLYF